MGSRAYRDADRRWVGGVASGLAGHLRWSVSWTRVGFVILTFAAGLGAVLYIAYWLLLPLHREERARPGRELGLLPLLALGAVLLGGALLASTISPWLFATNLNGILVVAVVVAGLGGAIIWQQADDETSTAGGPARWWRIGAGVALIGTGGLLLIADAADPVQAVRGLLVGLVVASGLALLALPFIRRQWQAANDERTARIREAERAEVAAAVHDSVLQTLTLIRTHAADEDAVARLARAEERRLRTWLYQPPGEESATLRSALERLAAQIESRYPVTVEVVAVGDARMSVSLQAMLGAASEALLNAAKHAGGAITLYAEVEPERVSIYVRDRGAGFDPQAVASDRLGVRESIIGRMQRNGGRAEIRSGPTGTEVHLILPREDVP